MYMCNMWKALLTLTAVWLTTFLYIITVMHKNNLNSSGEIQIAQPEAFVRSIVEEPYHEPSLQQEISRRSTMEGVEEFWNFVSAELKYLQAEPDLSRVRRRITRILNVGVERKRIITRNIRSIKVSDEVSDWKTREAKELSEIVQKRLRYYQNPNDCATAKKVVCTLGGYPYGFASQINKLCQCLMLAYGTNRTFVLDSKGWSYNMKGWESVFQPLSETCIDDRGETHAQWSNGASETQVLHRKLLEEMHPIPEFMPLAIPKDLSERVMRITGNPGAWWIGQLAMYIMRLNQNVAQYVEDTIRKMPYHNPIVGVHVRRTDKLNGEASFHPLEEYMAHVEEYFLLKEQEDPTVKRLVYLATDEPSLFAEATQKYPAFTFVTLEQSSALASEKLRYSDRSLRHLLIDLSILSRCEYLVCTFSSGVCRLAYELRHTLNPDISNNFRSLDDVYYFSGQRTPVHRALFSHVPQEPDEIGFEVGDEMHIFGNHWNGYFKGKNNRTGTTGLYPSHKVQYRIYTANMPKHPDEF